MNTQFYERYFLMYLEASQEQRDEAKRHWMMCHRQNIKADRQDLIIFSAKILFMIDMAQEYIERHEAAEHVTEWEYMTAYNA